MASAPTPPIEYVLDACAILAFLLREPGAVVVDNLMTAANTVCYAHAVNLCEVYYDFVRNHGQTTANR